MENDNKPKLKLVGTDGNAFAIIGACLKAGRKADFTQETIKAMQTELMSGDYDNVLATASKYFDIY